jgi:hypothetical protein
MIPHGQGVVGGYAVADRRFDANAGELSARSACDPPSHGTGVVDEASSSCFPQRLGGEKCCLSSRISSGSNSGSKIPWALAMFPRVEDQPAVTTAVNRAGAEDVVGRFAAGLETQLGATWPGGVEVSFGQWQKLALARGFMRDRPLLLVLDEPTAALDAETEHTLFERYAQAARGSRPDGRITVLVSHRFSTVRMADLIVVLDGVRVVALGTHEALMTKGGTVRGAVWHSGGGVSLSHRRASSIASSTMLQLSLRF